MLQEKQTLEFLDEPQDTSNTQHPPLDDLEDYLARTLSPASMRSLDAEEDERNAELERQVDEMIQFDTCNHKQCDLDDFDDALTIQLHTCNSQNCGKETRKGSVSANNVLYDLSHSINKQNLDAVSDMMAFKFF